MKYPQGPDQEVLNFHETVGKAPTSVSCLVMLIHHDNRTVKQDSITCSETQWVPTLVSLTENFLPHQQISPPILI